MPLLEAFPDESQIMKYKLATLPRGTAKLPVLNLGYSAITLKQGAQLAITPQTLNYLDNEQTFETSGYSATIADVRLMNNFTGMGINSEAATAQNATTTLGTNVSKTVIGSQINLKATTVNTLFGSQTAIRTTLTVVGLDSGARITIPVTINKTTT
jgi:Lhr-like helicase